MRYFYGSALVEGRAIKSLALKHKLAYGLIGLGVLCSSYFFIGALYMTLKAYTAELLIARAWQHSQNQDAPVYPWPWADTFPVFRLSIPSHKQQLIVLDSDSGASLAFGPGFMPASSPPGSIGKTVISAHRDSHFRFLQHIGLGESITLETSSGERYEYLVTGTRIIDTRQEALSVSSFADELWLVSCYPFNVIAPTGPLRYVVVAKRATTVETS